MKQISETIDGSIKDIIQLKTLDASLEYSQMFDALEDTPRDFQVKLVDALNSLGETMGVSPSETFNKVLCKSDDGNEDVTKKLYNWWRAFFEVLGKVVGNLPKVRSAEFTEKMDALMAEIMKAGDATATDEQEEEGAVVAEEYQPASLEDEAKMLDNMEFAIQHLGEVASKVQALVNFVNPYCGTTVNEVKNTMKFNKIDEHVDYSNDVYNGFKVGDKVCWTDPETGETTCGWTIIDITDEAGMEDDWGSIPVDTIVILENDDGSECEALLDEIEPVEGFTEEDDSMKKKMNEQAMDGGPWLPENEIIGMKVTGEAEEEPINWDDEDSYNDGGFERGMWVIWTDPDGGDESVWKILEMPKSEDDCFLLGQKDGSINEVFGWEIRPRDADVDEAPDMYSDDEDTFKDAYGESDGGQLNAQEFVDAMVDADEDMGDVFEVYDGGVEGEDTVYLNVLVHKESVSQKEVQAEFKDVAANWGWEFESFGYSSDMVDSIVDDDNCALVVYFKKAGEQQMNEEKVENELKKGDDGWTTIGQPVGESDGNLDDDQFKDNLMSMKPLKGDIFENYDVSNLDDGVVELNVLVNKPRVSYGEVEQRYAPIAKNAGWKFVSFAYADKDDTVVAGNDDMCAINIKFKQGVPMNEAQVVVDANDVWDVLELLDNDIANKELTDLINSHVRTEEEIMDAIDELCGDTITKKELNTLLSGRMVTLVDYLGLDVEQYESNGEFVDSDKPTSVELEGSTDDIKGGEVKDGDKKVTQDGETKTLVAGEGEKKKEMSDTEAATIMGGASGTDMDAADIGVSSHEVADPYKKPVCEMTVEQEVDDPWKLYEMLWGQGKENLRDLLESELIDEGLLMQCLEDMEIKNLTSINDAFAFDFPSILDSLGLDGEAWSQNLEIKRKSED